MAGFGEDRADGSYLRVEAKIVRGRVGETLEHAETGVAAETEALRIELLSSGEKGKWHGWGRETREGARQLNVGLL